MSESPKLLTHLFAFIFRASFAEAAMSFVLRLIASRRQYKITFFLSAARVDNKFRRSLRNILKRPRII